MGTFAASAMIVPFTIVGFNDKKNFNENQFININSENNNKKESDSNDYIFEPYFGVSDLAMEEEVVADFKVWFRDNAYATWTEEDDKDFDYPSRWTKHWADTDLRQYDPNAESDWERSKTQGTTYSNYLLKLRANAQSTQFISEKSKNWKFEFENSDSKIFTPPTLWANLSDTIIKEQGLNIYNKPMDRLVRTSTFIELTDEIYSQNINMQLNPDLMGASKEGELYYFNISKGTDLSEILNNQWYDPWNWSKNIIYPGGYYIEDSTGAERTHPWKANSAYDTSYSSESNDWIGPLKRNWEYYGAKFPYGKHYKIGHPHFITQNTIDSKLIENYPNIEYLVQKDEGYFDNWNKNRKVEEIMKTPQTNVKIIDSYNAKNFKSIEKTYQKNENTVEAESKNFYDANVLYEQKNGFNWSQILFLEESRSWQSKNHINLNFKWNNDWENTIKAASYNHFLADKFYESVVNIASINKEVAKKLAHYIANGYIYFDGSWNIFDLEKITNELIEWQKNISTYNYNFTGTEEHNLTNFFSYLIHPNSNISEMSKKIESLGYLEWKQKAIKYDLTDVQNPYLWKHIDNLKNNAEKLNIKATYYDELNNIGNNYKIFTLQDVINGNASIKTQSYPGQLIGLRKLEFENNINEFKNLNGTSLGFHDFNGSYNDLSNRFDFSQTYDWNNQVYIKEFDEKIIGAINEYFADAKYAENKKPSQLIKNNYSEQIILDIFNVNMDGLTHLIPGQTRKNLGDIYPRNIEEWLSDYIENIELVPHDVYNAFETKIKFKPEQNFKNLPIEKTLRFSIGNKNDEIFDLENAYNNIKQDLIIKELESLSETNDITKYIIDNLIEYDSKSKSNSEKILTTELDRQTFLNKSEVVTTNISNDGVINGYFLVNDSLKVYQNDFLGINNKKTRFAKDVLKYDFRIFSKEQTIVLPPIDGENPETPIISSNSNAIIITIITLSSLIALIFLIWLFIHKRRKFLKFYDENEPKNNSINVSTNKVENIQENNKINLGRKNIVSIPLLNEEKYLISNNNITFIKEENNVEKKIIIKQAKQFEIVI